MNESQHRAELAKIVEQRRRELGARSDISQTMRRLSESSNRKPVGKPSRSGRSGRALILTGVGATALLICVLGTAAVIWANTLVQTGFSDPGNTVQQFYGALHQTNYSQAYSYFSKNAKAQLSEQAFINVYSGYDRVDGIIQNFPIQNTTQKGDTAEIIALVTRRGDNQTGQLQTLHLVNSSGSWLIDTIELGATVPLPTATPSS